MDSVFNTQDSGAERIVVKWATPTEEVVAVVKLAAALLERSIAKPHEICITAPNLVWADNLYRASAAQGLDTSLCIARNETPALNRKLEQLEKFREELRGLSLVHRFGLDEMPECRHALQFVEGDETAVELATLVKSHLSKPRVTDAATFVPIVLMGALPASFNYVFIVGCVNGLVPSKAALDAGTLDEERSRFLKTVEAGKKRCTLSCFTKAPAALAQQCHLVCARVKQEQGQSVAMVQPSVFLGEAGHFRPTTIGGQALLRKYGLN